MTLKFLPVFLLAIVSKSFAQTQHTDTMWCAGTMVCFASTCEQEQPCIQFLHVHENEKTAVQAMFQTMEKYGQGCFVTWHSQDDRYVKFDIGGKHFMIDPNRIYSKAGLAASLKKNGDYTPEALTAAWKLSEAFLTKYINGKRLLVTVHNNTEGELSIRSFKSEAKEIHIDPSRDSDDFFLTTDPIAYQYLKARRFNIVLQKPGIKDDGSLSVYAATHHIPYINIEAQHGHLDQQLEMLDNVMALIDLHYKK